MTREQMIDEAVRCNIRRLALSGWGLRLVFVLMGSMLKNDLPYRDKSLKRFSNEVRVEYRRLEAA